MRRIGTVVVCLAMLSLMAFAPSALATSGGGGPKAKAIEARIGKVKADIAQIEKELGVLEDEEGALKEEITKLQGEVATAPNRKVAREREKELHKKQAELARVKIDQGTLLIDLPKEQKLLEVLEEQLREAMERESEMEATHTHC